LYFGQTATDGGHAFIVDGYAERKYHINWGWNGYCDGYFTLDKLNPNMENGFNYGQEMVINAWQQQQLQRQPQQRLTPKADTSHAV
ncbi:MAG: C10 family peptidase, partial [Prevotella sp.]